MNVTLAFQRTCEWGYAGLSEHNPDLVDCDGTIQLIKRVNNLIGVMMLRTPFDALRPGSDKERVITDFLDYLCKWEAEAKDHGYIFVSDSTCYGLKITLNATLEILHFLTYECNYDYIMTARLNQDALERFFGLARGACGSNDHPDSVLFGQMFRLMSSYSLVKPCKGSNVAGGEILHTLLEVSNISESRSGNSGFK